MNGDIVLRNACVQKWEGWMILSATVESNDDGNEQLFSECAFILMTSTLIRKSKN